MTVNVIKVRCSKTTYSETLQKNISAITRNETDWENIDLAVMLSQNFPVK